MSVGACELGFVLKMMSLDLSALNETFHTFDQSLIFAKTLLRAAAVSREFAPLEISVASSA